MVATLVGFPVLEKSECLDGALCLVPLTRLVNADKFLSLIASFAFTVPWRTCDGVTLAALECLGWPVKVFIENGSVNDGVCLAFSIVSIELFLADEQSFSRLHAMPNSTVYIHVGRVSLTTRLKYLSRYPSSRYRTCTCTTEPIFLFAIFLLSHYDNGRYPTVFF